MSIQASITTLKTLKVLDLRIGKLKEELTLEKGGMDEKAERHVELSAQVARIEGVISQMEGTKSELNQELRQHLNLVEKSREKLNRCRNEREANAVQRELEEIRRMAREREVEIQKLSGLIDDARKDLGSVEEERQRVASQIDETGGETAAKVRQLSMDLEEQLTKRNEALAQLSGSMQRKYEAVANLRGTGAAAAVAGSCTSCHISLPPMLYQEIMRQTEIHQCPSCHRLLYFSERASESPEESSETSAATSPEGDDSEGGASEGDGANLEN